MSVTVRSAGVAAGTGGVGRTVGFGAGCGSGCGTVSRGGTLVIIFIVVEPLASGLAAEPSVGMNKMEIVVSAVEVAARMGRMVSDVAASGSVTAVAHGTAAYEFVCAGTPICRPSRHSKRNAKVPSSLFSYFHVTVNGIVERTSDGASISMSVSFVPSKREENHGDEPRARLARPQTMMIASMVNPRMARECASGPRRWPRAGWPLGGFCVGSVLSTRLCVNWLFCQVFERSI